jgi:hypothetical protein
VSAFRRFIVRGMEDADRRVEEALRPLPLDETDRYLGSSALIAAIDRFTQTLQRWWMASEASRILSTIRDEWYRHYIPARHRALAVLLITAAAVHVLLTLLQGRHDGWFWMVVPALTTLFALLLLAGTQTQPSSD